VAQIASEALAERLIEWGVDTIFGLPGDGINGIMEGLRRHKDKLRCLLPLLKDRIQQLKS
jgi:pyruvate dehydrogenase (quinone)